MASWNVMLADASLLASTVPPDGRLAMAAREAFTRTVKGGFMPHVEHAGRGVLSLAVLGSKVEGAGFEKPHIGQIHVALLTTGFGVLA